MNRALLFGFCFKLLELVAVKAQTFECPRDGDGNCLNGDFANPADCGSFYQCSNCIPYLQHCQPGLHFSPRLDACVTPDEAKCIVSVRPTVVVTPAMTTQGIITTEDQGPQGTYPPLPPESLSASGAFLGLYEQIEVTGRVNFTVIYDFNGDYSRSQRAFIAHVDGWYYHSWSAGAAANTGVNLNFRNGSSSTADIYRTSTAHDDHDTTSRDIICYSSLGGSMYQSNSYRKYSDNLLSTSWTVFGLTDSMRQQVAFSAGRTSNWEGLADPLIFQKTLAAVGSGYAGTRSTFIAPSAGIYYISVSMGAFTGNGLQVHLLRNGVQVFQIIRLSTVHSGTDTMCRAIMLQLEQADEIRVAVTGTGSSLYSDGEVQTSFSGFLYDPLHAVPIAWSVAKDTSIPLNVNYLPKMEFEKILLNEGGSWISNDHEMIAPLPGYYYVHVSSGALPNLPVHLFITVNDQARVDLWRASGYHDEVDLLSRSAMLRLNAGDRVRVAVARETGVFSDEGLQTSFTGFLLFREG